MTPKIKNGVLITENLILDLSHVTSFTKVEHCGTIHCCLRTTFKSEVTIRKNCELVWDLLVDHFDWDIHEDDIQTR